MLRLARERRREGWVCIREVVADEGVGVEAPCLHAHRSKTRTPPQPSYTHIHMSMHSPLVELLPGDGPVPVAVEEGEYRLQLFFVRMYVCCVHTFVCSQHTLAFTFCLAPPSFSLAHTSLLCVQSCLHAFNTHAYKNAHLLAVGVQRIKNPVARLAFRRMPPVLDT